MAKDTVNGADNGVQKAQKGHKVPEGVPFTTLTAKQAQEASVRARNLRTKMRAALLDAAVSEGIDKLYSKALKQKDEKAMAVVEKAMKLVGLDFASSEEAVQRMDVKADANIKGKQDMTLNLTFSEARPKE